MTKKMDDIRPKGHVEVPCNEWCKGEWYHWVDALDPRLPNGPFPCINCNLLNEIGKVSGREVEQEYEKDPIKPGTLNCIWRFKDNNQRIFFYDYENERLKTINEIMQSLILS